MVLDFLLLGMRKHPILGFNKMHKGIDFETMGTLATASGDGIKKACWYGGAVLKWNTIQHIQLFMLISQSLV